MAPGGPTGEGLAQRFALTGLSGVAAETCTFPVDMVKTRMQLQGELSSTAPRKGWMRMLQHIVQEEGPRGLYRGLSPALVRHVPYTGSRILIYEQLRRCFTPAGAAHPSLTTKVAMGATAGALGQLLAVPADLVKVRMQADGRLVASGATPRYTSLCHALTTIVRQDGVRGLYKGATPAVQRAALVNLGELATYDQAKQSILASGMVQQEGIATHVGAAVFSGLVATVFSTPADVVKTRMMNQRADAPVYRSSLDCLLQTWRAEGAAGLYKGFLPTWGRLGPWQLVFWLSYEQLRLVSGHGGF